MKAICPFSPIPTNATSITSAVNGLPNFLDGSRQIGSVAIDKVIVRNSGFLYESLKQHPSEARRMGHRNPDVLIQVECFHFLPFEISLGQRFEERKLRRSSRHNDPAVVSFVNRPPHGGGCLFGRSQSESIGVVE